MANKKIKVEDNVGMNCLNPSERLHVHCTTSDADYKHPFGVPQHTQDDAIKLEINENTKVGMEFDPNQELFIFQDGNIGIGTPATPTKLDIQPQQLIPTVFCIHGTQNEILKLCTNGDIFVKGKLIENDIEVVDALREFLKHHEFLK